MDCYFDGPLQTFLKEGLKDELLKEESMYKNLFCLGCHGSLIDNNNDVHYIPTYNTPLVTTKADIVSWIDTKMAPTVADASGGDKLRVKVSGKDSTTIAGGGR